MMSSPLREKVLLRMRARSASITPEFKGPLPHRLGGSHLHGSLDGASASGWSCWSGLLLTREHQLLMLQGRISQPRSPYRPPSVYQLGSAAASSAKPQMALLVCIFSKCHLSSSGSSSHSESASRYRTYVPTHLQCLAWLHIALHLAVLLMLLGLLQHAAHCCCVRGTQQGSVSRQQAI